MLSLLDRMPRRERPFSIRLDPETGEPVLADGQNRLTLDLGRGLEVAPGLGCFRLRKALLICSINMETRHRKPSVSANS